MLWRNSLSSRAFLMAIDCLIGKGVQGHHGYQRACDLVSGQASNHRAGASLGQVTDHPHHTGRQHIGRSGQDAWQLSAQEP